MDCKSRMKSSPTEIIWATAHLSRGRDRTHCYMILKKPLRGLFECCVKAKFTRSTP